MTCGAAPPRRREVLHDADRLAVGHQLCSARLYARTGRAARTTGDRSAAWRWAVSKLPTARRPRSCITRRVHSHGALGGHDFVVGWKRGIQICWPPPTPVRGWPIRCVLDWCGCDCGLD
eukprot:1739581-Prymnesium_polylepis.1